jgi:transcriptional regulator with XRE-family HTH domain
VRAVKITTGSQVRAARAFLDWTIAHLAKESGVGISTVQEVEKINGEPRVVSTLQWRSEARDEAIAKIVATLEAAGITFLPETRNGVGLRGKIKS